MSEDQFSRLDEIIANLNLKSWFYWSVDFQDILSNLLRHDISEPNWKQMFG